MKRIVFLLAAMLFMAAANTAESPSQAAMRATLAPTGTLRAAFLGANPVQGRVDPTTGAITGPVADLVQELAKRLGVPYQILPSPDARAVIGHLQDHTADIGFLAYEPSRAAEVDFAGPYALMYNSYVVAENSPLKKSTEADRDGLVFGAVKGQAQELYLSGYLKKAHVQIFDRQPPREELEKLLTEGGLSAFGMNRQRALELDKASPTLRALDDSFLEVVQEFIVLKGDTAKRQILDGFAAEMRASGFVKASLDKAGLQESAGVASGTAP